MKSPDRIESVLCLAPHPHDETLGCGGSLLRHAVEGAEVHWRIMTSMRENEEYVPERISGCEREIGNVSAAYAFGSTNRAHFPSALLDTIPMSSLVQAIGKVVLAIGPTTIYLPYRNDVHSDHTAVFDAAVACTKSFRYPSVRSVYAYETLSETEFGLRPDDPGFRPSLFVDISKWLETKLSIMRLYAGELAEFPFPRSEACIRAQAALRGSQAGLSAAEGFMILKEIR